jgi:hypothetical protein
MRTNRRSRDAAASINRGGIRSSVDGRRHRGEQRTVHGGAVGVIGRSRTAKRSVVGDHRAWGRRARRVRVLGTGCGGPQRRGQRATRCPVCRLLLDGGGDPKIGKIQPLRSGVERHGRCTYASVAQWIEQLSSKRDGLNTVPDMRICRSAVSEIR